MTTTTAGTITSTRTTPSTARAGRTPEPLLTPAEVAALFRVDPRTVTRWANAGRLDAVRTLGGHRRYRADQVHALLATGSSAPGPRSSRPSGQVGVAG